MNIEDAKQLAKQGNREGAITMLRQMLEQNEGERELVLLELGVVERVLKEPKDPQKGFDKVYQRVGRDLYSAFQQGLRLSGEELSRRRYQRFRRMGAFLEEENESF